MSFSVFKDSRQPETHASTLLLYNGMLLSAWFGGTKEGHPDSKIWFSVRDTKLPNSQWEQSRAVAHEEGVAHWNPVLFHVPGTHRILLFYKVGSPISSWYTKLVESDDGGTTWTAPRELVPGDRGGRGPVKNKAIALSDGTILAPASLETPDGVWDCFSDISIDQGKTWTRSSFAPIDRSSWTGEGAIQPSFISSSLGKVSMLCRSSTGFVVRADSDDNGRTWGKMYLTSLYNNNSGLDAVRLENGTWIVAHNPVQQRWGPRTPLVLSGSKDEGKTWKRLLVLEDKPVPAGFSHIVALDTGIVNDGESEFSYPAIINDDEGGVYVSYTYERCGIKHVHIDAAQLEEKF